MVKSSTREAAVVAKGGVTYRIKRGDTLWDISATYYRNPWLYHKLARANSIGNRDRFLRELASIFLKIRILIPLLAVLLSTAGCGPRKVLGIPRGRACAAVVHGPVRRPCERGLHDPGSLPSSLTFPRAPYYLSLVFDSMDMADQAMRMLELAWNRCPDPWKREAGVLLAQKYNAKKNWPPAILVARKSSRRSSCLTSSRGPVACLLKPSTGPSRTR